MANIMVVDNDRDTWDYFQYAFSNEHSVKVTNCVDDLNENKGMVPDIVFLDLKKSYLDNSDKVSLFKNNYSSVSLCLMAQLNRENLQEIENLRENGIDFEVCRKPLNMNEIRYRIRQKINLI